MIKRKFGDVEIKIPGSSSWQGPEQAQSFPRGNRNFKPDPSEVLIAIDFSDQEPIIFLDGKEVSPNGPEVEALRKAWYESMLAPSCSHYLKEYVGFTEIYKYCVKCDYKENSY